METANSTPPACASCRWVNRGQTVPNGKPLTPGLWTCMSPQIPQVWDVVAGGMQPRYSSCANLRAGADTCGPQGRWWEERTEG